MFSSMMLYDMHIKSHDELAFIEEFKKVALKEIENGRGNGLQLVVDNYIIPTIITLKNKKIQTKAKRELTSKLKKHENTKAT